MARSRTRIHPGLAKRLAAGVVRDHVEAVTEAVAEEAKDRAPDAKTWTSDGSPDVRPSHREAHGQTVPENVPYRLDGMTYIRKGRKGGNKAGGWKLLTDVDLADRPRDPQLPLHQRISCNCRSIPMPGVIAAATRVLPVQVRGTKVTSGVEVVFPRIAESEFGSNGNPGSHFLSLAGTFVMARRR
ncbi:hypothetical protein [Nonomuraea glycinis]|uniref:hypothetical protein n=1 Tax=Nonomuraea glycinis TaxID=2047744 RepID=UPI0033BE57A0